LPTEDGEHVPSRNFGRKSLPSNILDPHAFIEARSLQAAERYPETVVETEGRQEETVQPPSSKQVTFASGIRHFVYPEGSQPSLNIVLNEDIPKLSGKWYKCIHTKLQSSRRQIKKNGTGGKNKNDNDLWRNPQALVEAHLQGFPGVQLHVVEANGGDMTPLVSDSRQVRVARFREEVASPIGKQAAIDEIMRQKGREEQQALKWEMQSVMASYNESLAALKERAVTSAASSPMAMKLKMKMKPDDMDDDAHSPGEIALAASSPPYVTGWGNSLHRDRGLTISELRQSAATVENEMLQSRRQPSPLEKRGLVRAVGSEPAESDHALADTPTKGSEPMTLHRKPRDKDKIKDLSSRSSPVYTDLYDPMESVPQNPSATELPLSRSQLSLYDQLPKSVSQHHLPSSFQSRRPSSSSRMPPQHFERPQRVQHLEHSIRRKKVGKAIISADDPDGSSDSDVTDAKSRRVFSQTSKSQASSEGSQIRLKSASAPYRGIEIAVGLDDSSEDEADSVMRPAQKRSAAVDLLQQERWALQTIRQTDR
jgi:hypothetical protein